MRIGIDVDDVLIDFCGEYEKKFGPPKVFPYITLKDGWPEIDREKVMMDSGFHIGMAAMPQASWGVNELIKQDHYIVYVTARYPEIRFATMVSFERNHIPNMPLIMCGKKKADILPLLDLDILIDDMPRYLSAVRKLGATTIMFDRQWNWKIKWEFRAYTWKDVVRYVKMSGM